MGDLISRGKLFNLLAPIQTLGEAYGIIQGMDTVDAVPVRCKDCRWRDNQDGSTAWMPCRALVTPNDFYCPRGERKDGKGNGNEAD